MDLSLSSDEAAFQDEVLAFLAEELRPAWCGIADSDARPNFEVMLAWQAVLARQGWLTPAWPSEHGGREWSPMQHHIFKSACAAARAPKILHMSIGMVGPLICAFGSATQKAFYLSRIVGGADVWCQGFSEPGSGSDLASLKTSARRDGDIYIVNGQKVWTTYAHRATRMLALVRTDPQAARPQAGISMLLIDMSLPGITVRPIRTIDGKHHFNEVFFDAVRVPATCLLGEENKGWDYARFLLVHERSGIADVTASKVYLEEVAGVADETSFGGDLARLEISLDALETLELRILDEASRGRSRDYDASMLKILGTELRQRILALGTDALGELAAVATGKDAPAHPSGFGAHLAGDALFFRAASIYGGSNEIQRNLIARALLRTSAEI